MLGPEQHDGVGLVEPLLQRRLPFHPRLDCPVVVEHLVTQSLEQQAEPVGTYAIDAAVGDEYTSRLGLGIVEYRHVFPPSR